MRSKGSLKVARARCEGSSWYEPTVVVHPRNLLVHMFTGKGAKGPHLRCLIEEIATGATRPVHEKNCATITTVSSDAEKTPKSCSFRNN